MYLDLVIYLIIVQLVYVCDAEFETPYSNNWWPK